MLNGTFEQSESGVAPKALFQVGDARTTSASTVFGYPAEIVPMSNPYALSPDGALVVRRLLDGKPIEMGQLTLEVRQGAQERASIARL